jgi:hypothetical protein
MCMRIALAAFAALGLAASPAIGAAEPSDGSAGTQVTARWVPRKLHFMYSPVSPASVTTLYSCDGLQDQITSILRQLGASKDLMVRAVGCTRPGGGPERFPGVDATFSVLEPLAAANQSSAHSPAVPARWETVMLQSDSSCQLLDQVRRNILPLFATRNVSSGCPPGLSVQVLRPVKPGR